MFLSVTQADIDAARFQIALHIELRRAHARRTGYYTSKAQWQWRVYVTNEDCPISQALRRTFGLTRGAASVDHMGICIGASGEEKYSDTTGPMQRFMAAWDDHERAEPHRFRLKDFAP